MSIWAEGENKKGFVGKINATNILAAVFFTQFLQAPPHGFTATAVWLWDRRGSVLAGILIPWLGILKHYRRAGQAANGP
jgi:hypothetical protein